ncbi:MAG: ABC transporter ATP-binding protein [Deltaproteobacteria bacterium]|nr:ABC transporter ATP-binding protein [Deltaproteobacteria bacterium]
MAHDCIIEAQGLVKTYPGADRPAVAGIDLRIKKGAFYGVLGPNGAGKTTTLSICSGLMRPDSGLLDIAGLDIRKDLTEIKGIIGLVPQETAVYPTLTARENLLYFGAMQGLSGDRLKTRVDYCLDVARLTPLADKRVETFSGGLKRRLSLVAGLIHEPKILFLDEPTVGIDPQSRLFIYESLKKMNSSGMTIVYTSHYMEEVETLCAEISIIDRGVIIAEGRVDDMVIRHSGSVIEVRLNAPPPEALRQKVSALPHVSGALFDAKTFTVKSAKPQQTIGDIMRLMEESNLNILSLCHGGLSLEKLFISLTGAKLRE